MPDNFLEALDKKEEGKRRYHKSNFHYDAAEDIYVCPEGKELKRWAEQKREGKPSPIVYRGESCGECPVREHCTTGEARTVSRDGRESLLEAMRQKLRSDEGKRIYARTNPRQLRNEIYHIVEQLWQQPACNPINKKEVALSQ